MFTAHSWAFADGVPPARKLLAAPCEKLMAQFTSHIIAVSEADHRLAVRYGVARPPKLSTVLNGVDPLPAPAERPEPPAPRIIMVGRFEAQKDQALLAAALSRVDRVTCFVTASANNTGSSRLGLPLCNS